MDPTVLNCIQFTCSIEVDCRTGTTAAAKTAADQISAHLFSSKQVMMATLPLNTSELCPLTTRLLPKELSHAFGIADEQSYDSRGHQPGQPSAAPAPAPVITSAEAAAVQPASSTGAAQLKRQRAPEQQQQQTAVGTTAASNAQQPSLPQSVNVTVSHATPSSQQQQQATSSSISAGLQQQAALVGGQLRGFPAAYISSHSLLPYAQQTVAALPHLSGGYTGRSGPGIFETVFFGGAQGMLYGEGWRGGVAVVGREGREGGSQVGFGWLAGWLARLSVWLAGCSHTPCWLPRLITNFSKHPAQHHQRHHSHRHQCSSISQSPPKSPQNNPAKPYAQRSPQRDSQSLPQSLGLSRAVKKTLRVPLR